jgi:phosphate transport system ATP-binding protein
MLTAAPQLMMTTPRPVESRTDDSPKVAAAKVSVRGLNFFYGSQQALHNISLDAPERVVMAFIGPSGCGKSTFLRTLNRMNDLIPKTRTTGEAMMNGIDIYDSTTDVVALRQRVGMVFQRPNPFPKSIFDNVAYGLQIQGKAGKTLAEQVEQSLRGAALWDEVKDRLKQSALGLSGGQQQRLCIARALAIKPRVLLMDEPCSALDPTSTRRIEQTIDELASEVTIVIVTHNMQQAVRVSHQCAFFLAEQGTPGVIVEHGPTDAMFNSPQDQRTNDYVNGRFG